MLSSIVFEENRKWIQMETEAKDISNWDKCLLELEAV